jgi:signal transduction histidine kinase
VQLVVRDTGIGLVPVERGRAFDRFYRGRDAESSKNPGTGLGLSIAKAIVEAHSGRILLEENDCNGGRGTKVTLRIPVRNTNGEHPQERREA